MRKSSTTASRPHIFNLSTSIVFLASPGDQQPLSPPQRSLVVGPPVMWEKGRTRKKTVQRYGSETRVHARSQKMVHLSRFQTGVENDPNLCCPSAYLCPRAYLVPVSRSLLNVNLSIGRTHRRCTGKRIYNMLVCSTRKERMYFASICIYRRIYSRSFLSVHHSVGRTHSGRNGNDL